MTKPRTTAEWQALDAAHFLHPFSDSRQIAERGTRLITRGEGVYLFDADGNRILDGMSGLWCVALGYGRRELADAAYAQLNQLPYYNSFFQCATEPAIELAAKLAELTPPQFQHVFFTGSGSEAIDTIIRLTRRYWQLEGQPDRNVIIARWNGYHGSTIAGTALGGMKYMHAQGMVPMPGVAHIDQPYGFEFGAGASPADIGLAMARQLEAKILELGVDRVAAFIGEPIQGAGGVIVPPETYWPEIQRICDKYGVLLVSDEVICGFGRTGRWFGCERFGFKPDLMTFAKGVTSGYIPLGGVMVGERIAKVLIEQGGDFNHGYTYSGHPVACAVALANIRLLQREHVVETVRDDTGPYLATQFATLADHPLVGEIQTCGLMGAIQLVKNKATGERFDGAFAVGMACRGHCFGNGLIMRAVGDRMIVAPPLVITRAQVDEMMSLIRRCLDLTLADATRNHWL